MEGYETVTGSYNDDSSSAPRNKQAKNDKEEKEEKEDEIEIVPREKREGDDRKYDSDNEKYDSHDRAMTLALGG